MKKYKFRGRNIGPICKLNMDGYSLKVKPMNSLTKILWRLLKLRVDAVWEPMTKIQKVFYWESYIMNQDMVDNINSSLFKERE